MKGNRNNTVISNFVNSFSSKGNGRITSFNMELIRCCNEVAMLYAEIWGKATLLLQVDKNTGSHLPSEAVEELNSILSVKHRGYSMALTWKKALKNNGVTDVEYDAFIGRLSSMIAELTRISKQIDDVFYPMSLLGYADKDKINVYIDGVVNWAKVEECKFIGVEAFCNAFLSNISADNEIEAAIDSYREAKEVEKARELAVKAEKDSKKEFNLTGAVTESMLDSYRELLDRSHNELIDALETDQCMGFISDTQLDELKRKIKNYTGDKHSVVLVVSTFGRQRGDVKFLCLGDKNSYHVNDVVFADCVDDLSMDMRRKVKEKQVLIDFVKVI